MKVNLICSGKREKVLTEIFKNRKIDLDKTAPICFVERGTFIPETGVVVMFDSIDLNELIDFLDYFQGKSPKNQGPAILTGKKDDTFEVLKPDSICFFISDGNTVYGQTEFRKLEINKKLYELEDCYSNIGFIRVNKSYVVNILKVDEIAPWFGGRLLLTFKGIADEIQVSRHYLSNFKKFLGL